MSFRISKSAFSCRFFNPQKFREYLEGNNLISKLQAKHDILKKALAEGKTDRKTLVFHNICYDTDIILHSCLFLFLLAGYKAELLTTRWGSLSFHNRHLLFTIIICLISPLTTSFWTLDWDTRLSFCSSFSAHHSRGRKNSHSKHQVEFHLSRATGGKDLFSLWQNCLSE